MPATAVSSWPVLASRHERTGYEAVGQWRQRGEDALCFDPTRQAIFLVASDKAGNWQRWYTQAIRLGR